MKKPKFPMSESLLIKFEQEMPTNCIYMYVNYKHGHEENVELQTGFDVGCLNRN